MAKFKGLLPKALGAVSGYAIANMLEQTIGMGAGTGAALFAAAASTQTKNGFAEGLEAAAITLPNHDVNRLIDKVWETASAGDVDANLIEQAEKLSGVMEKVEARLAELQGYTHNPNTLPPVDAGNYQMVAIPGTPMAGNFHDQDGDAILVQIP